MRRIRTIDGVELYDIICSRENVEAAVQAACRDHHKDPAVIRIRENPEPYIEAVIRILKSGTFHYSNFKTKRIFERGKQRNLCYTRTFPDRIIQHAVLQVVGPILLGTCIRDTYAAIKGKGLHRCNRQIRKDMHDDLEGTKFCFKMDVSKYFPSISRDKLFALIKKKIKCPRTLEILSRMIFEVPGKNGLPIGLYSSQIFSTFFLTYFDHFCKERLRIIYYRRYMDDVVILASSKFLLRQYKHHIEEYLNELILTIKPNWQIFPVEARGVDFVGYVFRHDYILLRKKIKIRYIRSCNCILYAVRHGEQITPHMMASKISYEGWIGKWCDGYRLVEKHTRRVDIALEFGAEAIPEARPYEIRHSSPGLAVATA